MNNKLARCPVVAVPAKTKMAGLAALALAAVALPVQVWAAVPTDVTDSIATAKVDASSVAGLMLGVFVGLLAFSLMRRQVR